MIIALSITSLSIGKWFKGSQGNSCAAVFVGIFAGRWWNGLLERRLRSLHKLHPRDIEQWGGEATLSDRLAIEGLLEVMEREGG